VTSPARRRTARIVGSVLIAAPLTVVLTASAAWADDSGDVTNVSSGSNWHIFLRLLLPTVVLLVAISVLAALPRLLRRPRYRPGRPWPHDPLWFAGPETPERALASARPLRGTGGASANW
jgi:hypothetical protein